MNPLRLWRLYRDYKQLSKALERADRSKPKMQGWRTVLFNGGIAALAAFLQYAVGVNWAELVNPTWAAIILAAANILLRWITTSPIFKKN